MRQCPGQEGKGPRTGTLLSVYSCVALIMPRYSQFTLALPSLCHVILSRILLNRLFTPALPSLCHVTLILLSRYPHYVALLSVYPRVTFIMPRYSQFTLALPSLCHVILSRLLPIDHVLSHYHHYVTLL